ncbi:uncharacterized protein F4822DRAFT_427545 [Hypoxylon trugodes]|uniref:uncharacterized protein n=1 Tax=Hypoxylon trugodes TaxID=326681 RepID=UPI00219A47F5|nr:uncharacterized protein F4822DRAFT_427545 [Hypoxylon trugodes]KAI1391688.1 hypothetical protein F4822DRAFT_427545 [Hypoxylon trugodes]
MAHYNQHAGDHEEEDLSYNSAYSPITNELVNHPCATFTDCNEYPEALHHTHDSESSVPLPAVPIDPSLGSAVLLSGVQEGSPEALCNDDQAMLGQQQITESTNESFFDGNPSVYQYGDFANNFPHLPQHSAPVNSHQQITTQWNADDYEIPTTHNPQPFYDHYYDHRVGHWGSLEGYPTAYDYPQPHGRQQTDPGTNDFVPKWGFHPGFDGNANSHVADGSFRIASNNHESTTSSNQESFQSQWNFVSDDQYGTQTPANPGVSVTAIHFANLPPVHQATETAQPQPPQQQRPLHKCRRCSMEFVHVVDRNNHLLDVHKENHRRQKSKEGGKFKCPYCDQPAYKAKAGLTRHIRDKHDPNSHYRLQAAILDEKVACHLCGDKFESYRARQNHISKDHNAGAKEPKKGQGKK